MSEKDTTRTPLDDAIDTALHGIAGAEAPYDLRQRVLARLRSAGPSPAPLSFRLLLAGAAALAIVVVAGVVLRVARWPGIGSPTAGGPPAPAVARAESGATASRLPSAPPSPRVASRARPSVTRRTAPDRVALPGAPPALALDPLPSPEPLAVATLDEPPLSAPPVTVAALTIPEIEFEPLTRSEP